MVFSPEQILQLPPISRYLAILPFAMLEGPLISLASGFLVQLGYLNVFAAYLVLVIGDVLPDITYYFTGRFGAKTKFVMSKRTRFKIIGSQLELAKKMWARHPGKTMLLTKFAYGLSTPLLISAGLVNMPAKKFISHALPITLIQHIITMTLGYYLGASFEIANKYINNAGIFVAIAMVVFIILFSIIQRYARSQIEKIEQET